MREEGITEIIKWVNSYNKKRAKKIPDYSSRRNIDITKKSQYTHLLALSGALYLALVTV